MKTKQEREDEISDLCDQAGCPELLRKRHLHQYADHRWNPHPSPQFVAWFSLHRECGSVDSRIAFNCQCYRDEYWEAKTVGAV